MGPSPECLRARVPDRRPKRAAVSAGPGHGRSSRPTGPRTGVGRPRLGRSSSSPAAAGGVLAAACVGPGGGAGPWLGRSLRQRAAAGGSSARAGPSRRKLQPVRAGRHGQAEAARPSGRGALVRVAEPRVIFFSFFFAEALTGRGRALIAGLDRDRGLAHDLRRPGGPGASWSRAAAGPPAYRGPVVIIGQPSSGRSPRACPAARAAGAHALAWSPSRGACGHPTDDGLAPRPTRSLP